MPYGSLIYQNYLLLGKFLDTFLILRSINLSLLLVSVWIFFDDHKKITLSM